MKNQNGGCVMKKLLLIVGALSLCGVAAAWDVPGNPDRYISLGLHTGIEHLSGDSSVVINPGPSETVHVSDASYSINAAGFDIRVPLFTQMTFTMSYDKLSLNRSDVRTGNTYQTHEGIRGDRVDFGVRFYFVQ